MFLTEQDIVNLTNKKQHSAQAKQLDRVGLTYLTRGDGSLVVSVSHVEKLLGGDYSGKGQQLIEPNWGALDNAEAA